MLVPVASGPLIAAGLVALSHLGGATIWVFSTIRLQQIVPTQVRGRVFAAEQGLFTVVLSISTYVYGRLIDLEVASLSTLTFALGVSLLLPAALWALRGRRLGWATDTTGCLREG